MSDNSWDPINTINLKEMSEYRMFVLKLKPWKQSNYFRVSQVADSKSYY